MEDITEFTEPEDRYCPICDKKIKKGSPIHKCSKKKIKELEKRYVKLDDPPEEEEEEEERTYDDRLKEFDDHYNNENYYDLEEE